MQYTPKQILLKYWGYSSFRPLQEEIIDSVLQGRDTLALMPTGGGKSLCFQVPGLIRPGVCLVVTPLIALMKDQAEGLKRRGIPADAVYAGMPRDEITRILDNCLYGNTRFLYLSPERLLTDMMREYIERMQVSLLAVDEAHCISQWGYDFRPPYLQIIEVRQLLQGIPVIAVTATATPEVVHDIQDKLGFREENVFRKSFERKNLTYFVFREENKLARLLRILDKTPGSGIVYVRNRRHTREIDEYLRRNGFTSAHYHAGLSAAERHQRQEEWLKGRVRIMVATNAFGMGIDKPDVRFVVHMDLPDSLEAYFQEAGRGGRDGKRAYAVLLYEEADVREVRRFHELSFPPLAEVKKIYRLLGNFFGLATGAGRDAAFDFDLDAFCSRYSLQRLVVHHSLRLLESEGYILQSPLDESQSKIYIPLSQHDLYRFQVSTPSYDAFIKLLLRSYSGIISGPVSISEKELARRAASSEEEVVRALRYLHKLDVVRYSPRRTLPQIVFLTERLDERDLMFTQAAYQKRQEVAAARLEAVISYVSKDTRCRSQTLLAYFGEKDGPRCGSCDVCLEKNKTGMSELELDRTIRRIKAVLRAGALGPEDLLVAMGGMDEDQVLKALSWLRDAGKIDEDDEGRYRWK